MPGLRHGTAVTPPLPYLGAYVLVAAALDDRSATPRRAHPRRDPGARQPRRLRLRRRHRARPRRAPRRGGGAARRGRDRARPACPGGAGCCTPSCWSAPSSTGWGDPVPALRADLAAHEQAGDAVARPHLPGPAAPRRCPDPAHPRGRRRACPAAGPRDHRARGRGAGAGGPGPDQRPGRRAAVPLAAHGRHARREPAGQDRCTGTDSATVPGRANLGSRHGSAPPPQRRAWPACPPFATSPTTSPPTTSSSWAPAPAGLATALSAARHGARVLVVDRHPGTSTRPRATGISLRTMEIFRAWGVADAVRERAVPVDAPRHAPAPPWSRRRARPAGPGATRSLREIAAGQPGRAAGLPAGSGRADPGRRRPAARRRDPVRGAAGRPAGPAGRGARRARHG